MTKKYTYFQLSNIFFFQIFFITTVFILKKKNKKTTKEYDLLIDDVSDVGEIERYGNLRNYIKSNIIRVNRKLKLKKRTTKVIFRKNYHNYNLSIQDFLFFIRMIYDNIVCSFNAKINVHYFFLSLINDYYFYDSFFKDYKFKYAISSRHYTTNNIKNFILKKNKTKSCVIQKNIDTENTNGFFYDIENLFILGNKIKIKDKRFCNVKNQIPVGSFFMEDFLYRKKNKINHHVKNFDILCLGCNEQYPGSVHDTYNNHNLNYIEHLNWLKKISLEFPKLKVGFIHHDNNKNNFEKFFLKNTNVVYIDEKTNSYALCYKAKFICSFASTMIIELFSINKKGYYLDPNYQNVQYMKNINKNIRINTYKKFKNFYFNSNKNKIIFNDYCLNSYYTSYKIFNYLVK